MTKPINDDPPDLCENNVCTNAIDMYYHRVSGPKDLDSAILGYCKKCAPLKKRTLAKEGYTEVWLDEPA